MCLRRRVRLFRLNQVGMSLRVGLSVTCAQEGFFEYTCPLTGLFECCMCMCQSRLFRVYISINRSSSQAKDTNSTSFLTHVRKERSGVSILGLQRC